MPPAYARGTPSLPPPTPDALARDGLRRGCPRSLRGPAPLRACHASCLPTAARCAPIAPFHRPSPLAAHALPRFPVFPPGLSRRLLTHTPRQATPTYARWARSGGGAYCAPGLSRAVLQKATARASPYADAVCRRIALKVSANVVGRRHLYLPPPVLVCRVPCAYRSRVRLCSGRRLPAFGGFAERTARTPTVPGARTRRRFVLRIRRRPPRRRPPLTFGDCGTRHTSTFAPSAAFTSVLLCVVIPATLILPTPGGSGRRGRAAVAEFATPTPS